MRKIIRPAALFALLASLGVPLFAAAQTGINISKITPYSGGIINVINGILVPVLMALAFIVFLWGVYKYFILGAADEKSRTDGRQFTLWGIIGFVIILSLWGIVNLLMGTLGFSVGTAPAYPTIGTGNYTISGGGPTSGVMTGAQNSYNACMAQQGSTAAGCEGIRQQYIQDNSGNGPVVTGAQSAYDSCMAQQGSTSVDCAVLYNQYIIDNQTSNPNAISCPTGCYPGTLDPNQCVDVYGEACTGGTPQTCPSGEEMNYALGYCQPIYTAPLTTVGQGADCTYSPCDSSLTCTYDSTLGYSICEVPAI